MIEPVQQVPQRLPFDYAAIDAHVAADARAAAERINRRLHQSKNDIIEIGRDLIAMKRRLGHGRFLPWIASEFGMSDQSARNFMNVAEAFGGKSKTVLDLPQSAL